MENKKNNNSLGKIIIIVIAVLFVIGVIGNLKPKKKDQPVAETPETTTEEQATPPVEQESEPVQIEASEPDSELAEASESEKEEEPESDRVAAYKALIEASLDDSFKDNYEVKVDEGDKIITINVWADGVVQELTLAQQGNQKYIDDWNNTSEIIRSTSEKFYSGRNSFNLPDYHVSINVINNVNKENTLLSTLDNIIFYNVLDETQ